MPAATSEPRSSSDRVDAAILLGVCLLALAHAFWFDHTVDDAYILESIREPGLKIVEGFANAMPPFSEEQLSDDQVADIIEFMKTLK